MNWKERGDIKGATASMSKGVRKVKWHTASNVHVNHMYPFRAKELVSLSSHLAHSGKK